MAPQMSFQNIETRPFWDNQILCQPPKRLCLKPHTKTWKIKQSVWACVDGSLSCGHRHVGGVCDQCGPLHDGFFLERDGCRSTPSNGHHRVVAFTRHPKIHDIQQFTEIPTPVQPLSFKASPPFFHWPPGNQPTKQERNKKKSQNANNSPPTSNKSQKQKKKRLHSTDSTLLTLPSISVVSSGKSVNTSAISLPRSPQPTSMARLWESPVKDRSMEDQSAGGFPNRFQKKNNFYIAEFTQTNARKDSGVIVNHWVNLLVVPKALGHKQLDESPNWSKWAPILISLPRHVDNHIRVGVLGEGLNMFQSCINSVNVCG